MPGRWTTFLRQIVLIRTGKDSWRPAVFWGILAVVSMSAATIVALQPGQLHDLHLVRTWLAYWTEHFSNPYPHFGELDYPPLAFLVLWPLSLPSDATIAFWFLPVSIVLTAAAGWVLLRWLEARVYIKTSTPERIALIALMLAGGGARTSWHLGQTVALSLLFGAFALRWTRRRPLAAGVALALCSFKPNIALGFGLAILLTEGVSVPLLAGGILASFSLLFSVIVGAPPLSIGEQYLTNLIALYEGADRISGMLSLRRVLDQLIHDYLLRSIIYAVIATATLVAIIRVSRARRFDATTQAQVAVACLLWSVLFLPHQLHNSLMAVPALWLMMWPEAGLIRRQSVRVALVAAYVLFGVLNVPYLFRLASAWRPEFDWAWDVSYLLSPLRMAAVFFVVTRAMYRGPDLPEPDVAPPGGLIRRLLHDTLVRIALVIWVPLAAVYLIPGVPLAVRERLGDTYSTLPLWPLAIAAAVMGIARIGRPWERRVWVYQAASFACLMGIEAARVGMPEETFWWNMASDWSYVAFYVFQLLAAVESHRVARLAGLARRQAVAAVVLCGMAGALATWFAVFRPQVYADGIPSFLLYMALDAGIVVLFVRAGQDSIDPRWRQACRGLALASCLFCVADFVELLYYRETWGFPAGTIADLAWTLPTMCYILTIRLVRLDETDVALTAWRKAAVSPSG